MSQHPSPFDGDPTRGLVWILKFAQLDLESLPLCDLQAWGHELLATNHDDAAGVSYDGDAGAMNMELNSELARSRPEARGRRASSTALAIRAVGSSPHHTGASGFPSVTLRTLHTYQQELRRALQELHDGRAWVLPAIPRTVVVRPAMRDFAELVSERADEGSRRLVTRYSGSFDAAFYMTVADILKNGWETVARCSGVTCGGRWFVPVDARQKFCTQACAQKTQWRKFQPKRQRDYEEEYRKRRQKRLPPGAKVKIQHRSKQRQKKRGE